MLYGLEWRNDTDLKTLGKKGKKKRTETSKSKTNQL